MTNKQFLQQFRHFIEAPNGIQKLRELILQLAVQGKLVPQEDNWRETCLSDFGEWAVGSGFPKTEQGKEGLEILFAKVSDMNLPENAKFVVTTNHTISESTAKKLRVNVHAAGTVIFPKIGGAIATNKRRILTRPTAIDNNCLGITPKESVSTDWLYLVLSSIDFSKYQAGTSVPALSQGTLSKIPVRLPVPPEQHRIVAKVNELMALCDRLETERNAREATHQRLIRAVHHPLTETTGATATTGIDNLTAWRRIRDNFADLYTTLESVQALRQTILQLAVQGKLVGQDPNECIEDFYEALPTDEKLPITWRMLNFGKYCDIQGGNQPPKSQFITEPKEGYVRLLQIRDLGDKPVPVFIPSDSINRFCNEGEILIGRYGASVGKIFWAKDGAYNVALAKFIWPENTFIPQYAFLVLKSDFFQAHLAGASRSAQAGFNKGDLAKIDFPLPPLSEQYRIVAKVDELMAICDQLETNIRARSATAARYADSIVQQIAAA